MTHKLLSIIGLCFALCLCLPSESYAQDGSLWGNTTDSSVVYRIDPARIKDPLEVRIASSAFDTVQHRDGRNDSAKVSGLSLWTIFSMIVREATQFCIVEVKITPNPASDAYRNFDYLYTEWSNVLPAKNAAKKVVDDKLEK